MEIREEQKMILSDALIWISIPFVLTTIFFALYKGENIYYESDAYDGNGTAHPVLFEKTTCERRETANGSGSN
tara:strand:+ start:774 stop:992 length:219 start_codon:yes stop_codon:yes gene_type:complete